MDVVADNPPILVSDRLTGLPPGTTIHYRLVGANDLIRGAGEDATFVTSAVPAPAPAPDPPPPVTPPAPDAPPTPDSPPTPDPPRAAAPVLSRVHVGTHSVRLRIAVDSAADVTLHGTLTGRIGGRRRTLALGTARAHFRDAGRRTLTLELSARARHAIKRWRAVRIELVADAGSAGGRITVRAEARASRR
jgi:hypothetical protein